MVGNMMDNTDDVTDFDTASWLPLRLLSAVLIYLGLGG